MVHTGFQIEPCYKGGWTVCEVEGGKIIKEKIYKTRKECYNFIDKKYTSSLLEKNYENNFDFIKKHNLNVGDMIKEKDKNELIMVKTINPHYGWICSEFRQINICNITEVWNRSW